MEFRLQCSFSKRFIESICCELRAFNVKSALHLILLRSNVCDAVSSSGVGLRGLLLTNRYTYVMIRWMSACVYYFASLHPRIVRVIALTPSYILPVYVPKLSMLLCGPIVHDRHCRRYRWNVCVLLSRMIPRPCSLLLICFDSACLHISVPFVT